VALDKRKAIQRATALIQEGQFQKAIADYEAILKTDPSDPTLYNALGDLYARVGSSSEAVARYLKLIEALRAEGLRYRAIALYKKIIKLDPDNLDALLACADLYAEEGLRAEAKHQYLSTAERALKLGFDKIGLEVYERLSRIEPGDPSIAAKLALLLARDGRRPEAAELLGRLAMEARAKGRHDDARLLYQQMAETCPEMFAGWYCLGRLEFESGRLREAEAHLRRASEIDASSPLPHLLLGHLYRQEGRRDAARASWQALLRRDPGHLEARHLLGQLYLSEGETDAAVREFDAVAESVAGSGDLERAIAVLGELGPAADHPLIQERLGGLLARSERLPEAKAAYAKAAETHRAGGRNDEHERLLRCIAALDPLDPDDSADEESLSKSTIDDDVPVVVLDESPHPGGTTLSAVTSQESEAGWSHAESSVADDEGPWVLDLEERGDLRLVQAEDDGDRPAATAAASHGDRLETRPEDVPAIDRPDNAEMLSALLAEFERDEEARQAEGGDTGTVEIPGDPSRTRPSGRTIEAADAHFQLGMAYREMGLLDDAIGEFRRSAADERLTCHARHMIGRCLLAKGHPDAAIREFAAGLSIAGRPAEEYLAIKCDLATAHQSAGNLASAKAILRELEAESPSYRTVASRVMRLRAQLERGGAGCGAAEPGIDGARGKESS
jgi:tetratricopeptide (TPR) repeat protein